MATARCAEGLADPADGRLPDDLSTALRAQLAALASLEGTEGIALDYLRFSAHVAQAHAAARAATRAAQDAHEVACPPAPGGRELPRDTVTFESGVLRALLRELTDASRAAAPVGGHLTTLAAAADAESDLLGRLAAAAVLPDDPGPLHAIARELGFPVPPLLFLGRLFAHPFVAEARHRRGPRGEWDGRDVATRDAGRCPACGLPPDLAVLCRDDGRRRLHCGVCGEVWLAPRLMCVACGTRDQTRLGTLYVQETDARWVETCDACGSYLKTVDERRLPVGDAPVPGAEQVASLYLDLMAEDAGYVRPDLTFSPSSR